MRSTTGLPCFLSLVAALIAGCLGEVERETFRCGDPARLIEPTIVEETCEKKCDIESCRDVEKEDDAAEKQACLEDCRLRSKHVHGALWLVWQQCRVENSCDGVFDDQNCDRFKIAFHNCACTEYAICQSSNPEEGQASEVDLAQCIDRLGEPTCGTKWSAYSSRFVRSSRCIECEEYCATGTCETCNRDICREFCQRPAICAPRCGNQVSAALLQVWDDCNVDAYATRVASTCGDACVEPCLGPGPGEALCVDECGSSPPGPACVTSICWDPTTAQAQCLSDCKSRGERPLCGEPWLNWQECRDQSSCDGVFELESCAAKQDSYYDCACESIVSCQLASNAVCEARLDDRACGGSWDAYTTCLNSLANCQSCPEPYTGNACPPECKECCAVMTRWEDCTLRDERVEATCRAACTEGCRDPDSNEMSCLRGCKDNGKSTACGAAWLNWQECRVRHRCDGVFAVDSCFGFEQAYNDCLERRRSGP